MGKILSIFKSKTNFTSKSSERTKSRPDNVEIKENNIFEMNGLQVIETLDLYENVLNINSVLDEKCLFGHQKNYTLELFDYLNRETVKIWKGHQKDITRSIYCARIDRYISCSRDRTIKIWNTINSRPELDLIGHDLVVTAISVDNENTNLISGSRDNCLNLWDLKVGKIKCSANISRNLISDTFWSNDNKLLIQTGEDKEVRIWDPSNLKIIFNFPKKQYIQSSCHISSDNHFAITSSNGFQGNGCEITIWDLRQRKMMAELYGHEQTVTDANILKNDSQIVSCSNDSTVRLWDMKTMKLQETIYVSNTLTSVAESQDMKYILVSSLSNGIHILKK